MSDFYSQEGRNRLLVELEGFERQGISIWLEGNPSDSQAVSRMMSVREDSAYMRDYVYDEGVLRELHFDRVNHKTGRNRKHKNNFK